MVFADGAIRAPVDATILVVSVHQVIFQDVEQTSHLREDQHTTAALHETRQKLVQKRELTRALDEVIPGDVRRTRFGTLEQVRVVAALAKLHDDIQKPRSVRATVHNVDVLLQDALVKRFLHLSHANLENCLLLRREAGFDLRLQSTQQEGA